MLITSWKMEDTERRYIGIDSGKREYTMAGIGRNGKMNIHQSKGPRTYRFAIKD
jgi:hypothetical protein